MPISRIQGGINEQRGRFACHVRGGSTPRAKAPECSVDLQSARRALPRFPHATGRAWGHPAQHVRAWAGGIGPGAGPLPILGGGGSPLTPAESGNYTNSLSASVWRLVTCRVSLGKVPATHTAEAVQILAEQAFGFGTEYPLLTPAWPMCGGLPTEARFSRVGPDPDDH